MAQSLTPKCPICGKNIVEEFRPFCSSRCAQIDLGRWFNGAYAIPTEEPVLDDFLGDPES